MEAKLIAEVSFNRDDDGEEFGEQDRIVRIYREEDTITFCFELGRKEDDTINLSFDGNEIESRLKNKGG